MNKRITAILSTIIIGFGTFLQDGISKSVMADESMTTTNLNSPETHLRIKAGYEYAKKQGIALDLKHKNPALVGLGSYLVNAIGGCNDCHTQPSFAEGGNPYLHQALQINTSNYMAGGAAFGPFCSRNLTVDSGGKPAGMDLKTFIYVMHTGCDPDGANFNDPASCKLLQVMPWPANAQMTELDLNAIYEYLGAIPAAQPAANAQCIPQ
jgi:hypothetical protein